MRPSEKGRQISNFLIAFVSLAFRLGFFAYIAMPVARRPRRLAKLLVDQHGTDAPIRAAQQADELLAASDLKGQATWRRITRAAEELRRTRRRVGELAN